MQAVPITESWIYSRKCHEAVVYIYVIIKLCIYNFSVFIIMDRQAISFLIQQCIALDDFSEGHSDYWAFGLLRFRTIGHSEYWAFGLLDLRTIEISDYWAFGLLGLRTIGTSDYWAFGLSGLRTTGLSYYRALGLLGLGTIGPTPLEWAENVLSLCSSMLQTECATMHN